MTTTAAKSKENLYTKPGVGKSYRCEEPEHRSNECPKRKQVNMTNYEDDGKKEVEIEKLNDLDFAEEQGDSVACVVQRLLCNKGPRHYAATSKLLLKVFGQEQDMQHHH